MAREIYSRLCLSGTLITESPLHVGGYGDDVDTDLPLARDGAGQLYIPGTSLAGAFRSFAEMVLGEATINKLWGYQDKGQGNASFVLVEDATVENADPLVIEIRDHVGIDREYGCAAENIKYDRAILPRGTRLSFKLAVEVADPHNDRELALGMIAALKEALEHGKIRLGAAKTRGLGRIKLESASVTEQILGTREGILAVLEQADPVEVDPGEIERARLACTRQRTTRLKVEIHWEPVGPMMVKAGLEGIAADVFPLVSHIEGEIAPVLPGSSIKGTFRAHAERIVRTLRQDLKPSWLEASSRQRFLDALEVELINELFGRRGEKAAADKNRSWLPGLGALSVADCYAKKRVDSEQWRAIETATDDFELRRALDKAELQTWSHDYHVAIDRWLGSAAEGFLYTVLEPHRTEWEPIQLEINLLRIPDDLRIPAIVLLLLILRDLARGQLPLGYATHRGMGTVKVNTVLFGEDDPDHPWDQWRNIRLENGELRNIPPSWNEAWKQWIERNQENST